jgi:hypothetical protein
MVREMIPGRELQPFEILENPLLEDGLKILSPS